MMPDAGGGGGGGGASEAGGGGGGGGAPAPARRRGGHPGRCVRLREGGSRTAARRAPGQIGLAPAAAQDRGHCLGGFSRRSSQNGFRFVARCRSCGQEGAVRADGASGHSMPLPVCPQSGVHRPQATLAAEDYLLAEIAELVDAARRSTALPDRVAALTQIERLSAWAL